MEVSDHMNQKLVAWAWHIFLAFFKPQSRLQKTTSKLHSPGRWGWPVTTPRSQSRSCHAVPATKHKKNLPWNHVIPAIIWAIKMDASNRFSWKCTSLYTYIYILYVHTCNCNYMYWCIYIYIYQWCSLRLEDIIHMSIRAYDTQDALTNSVESPSRHRPHLWRTARRLCLKTSHFSPFSSASTWSTWHNIFSMVVSETSIKNRYLPLYKAFIPIYINVYSF